MNHEDRKTDITITNPGDYSYGQLVAALEQQLTPYLSPKKEQPNKVFNLLTKLRRPSSEARKPTFSPGPEPSDQFNGPKKLP